MSDLEPIGDPDHTCGPDCAPYVPVACQDLEDMEESAHIDALYDVLERTREHAALLLLALSRAGVESVRLPARAAALLLDLGEDDVAERMDAAGEQQPYAISDVVDLATEIDGEDGYLGRALAALFRLELDGLNG